MRSLHSLDLAVTLGLNEDLDGRLPCTEGCWGQPGACCWWHVIRLLTLLQTVPMAIAAKISCVGCMQCHTTVLWLRATKLLRAPSARLNTHQASGTCLDVPDMSAMPL